MKKLTSVLVLSLALNSCGSQKEVVETKAVTGYDGHGNLVTLQIQTNKICRMVWTDFMKACVDAGYELVAQCAFEEELCSGKI